MKRGRFATYSDENPIYFITTTVANKLPIFFNNDLCEIILKNLNFYREKLSFAVYAYVIMPTHIHLLVQQLGEKNISDFMRDFKKYTSVEIIKYCKNQVGSKDPTLTKVSKTDNTILILTEKKTSSIMSAEFSGQTLTKVRETNDSALTLADKKVFSVVPVGFSNPTFRQVLDIFQRSAEKYTKKHGANYQVWQERFDDTLVWSEKVLNIKIDYIHNNPAQGHWNLVKDIQEYKYSSARNYYVDDDSVFKINKMEM